MKPRKISPDAPVIERLNSLISAIGNRPFEIHRQTSATDAWWSNYVVSVRAHPRAGKLETVASGSAKSLVEAITKATADFIKRNPTP